MTSIIQTISYNKEEAKHLLEKLSEHLGVHRITIVLTGGEVVEGVVSEVGSDYITIIEDGSDVLIPASNILLIRYSH